MSITNISGSNIYGSYPPVCKRAKKSNTYNMCDTIYSNDTQEDSQIYSDMQLDRVSTRGNITGHDIVNITNNISSISENVASLIRVNDELVNAIQNIQHENTQLVDKVSYLESCIASINNNMQLMANTMRLYNIEMPLLHNMIASNI